MMIQCSSQQMVEAVGYNRDTRCPCGDRNMDVSATRSQTKVVMFSEALSIERVSHVNKLIFKHSSSAASLTDNYTTCTVTQTALDQDT